jgi:hypothetical protein
MDVECDLKYIKTNLFFHVQFHTIVKINFFHKILCLLKKKIVKKK